MTTSQDRDAVLRRIIACLFLLLSLTLTSYGAYTSLRKIPAHEGMFRDFGMSLPTLTMFLVQNGWIPLGVCTLGVAVSALAVLSTRLWVLALAGLACLVSTGVLLLTQWALDAAFITIGTAIQGG